MNISILEGEIWSNFPIHGYPKYKVSNMGRVYSEVSKGVMKPQVNEDGYLKIRAGWKETGRNYFIHRLVAMAFVDNPNKYPIVNHIDGVKTNNVFSNLEWCTQLMNVRHSFKNGLQVNPKGEDHSQSILTNEKVIKIRKMHKEGYSRKQLSAMFGTKPTNIKDIVARRSWKHI